MRGRCGVIFPSSHHIHFHRQGGGRGIEEKQSLKSGHRNFNGENAVVTEEMVPSGLPIQDFGTFLGPFLDLSGAYCRYFHQNAKKIPTRNIWEFIGNHLPKLNVMITSQSLYEVFGRAYLTNDVNVLHHLLLKVQSLSLSKKALIKGSTQKTSSSTQLLSISSFHCGKYLSMKKGNKNQSFT